LIRRGLALGAGLLVLILIVLGVRGCLDARKNRALSDYADDVTQIVAETDQTSKAFFGKLEDPGSLSVTDFVAEVSADRSAMDNYASRIDGLDAPGDMGNAQDNLELVYQLRSSAMGEIADRMSTALGDVGSEQAMTTIANQIQVLHASDVLYKSVARPEINGVLSDNGVSGSDVPESVFVPDGIRWLDEVEVGAALGTLSAGGGETSGIHGLGLAGVSVNGTELVEGGATGVVGEGTPEVEVQVENQGESTENEVTVSVTVNGGNTLQQDISSIGSLEIQSASIPLTPAPEGEVTLEVEAQPVPGERVSTNNKASYTVVFE
jgi:CARDB